MGAKDAKDANRPNSEPTCFYLSKQEAHRFLDNSSQQVPQGISRTNTTNKWYFQWFQYAILHGRTKIDAIPLGSSTPTKWLKTTKLRRLNDLTVDVVKFCSNSLICLIDCLIVYFSCFHYFHIKIVAPSWPFLLNMFISSSDYCSSVGTSNDLRKDSGSQLQSFWKGLYIDCKNLSRTVDVSSKLACGMKISGKSRPQCLHSFPNWRRASQSISGPQFCGSFEISSRFTPARKSWWSARQHIPKFFPSAHDLIIIPWYPHDLPMISHAIPSIVSGCITFHKDQCCHIIFFAGIVLSIYTLYLVYMGISINGGTPKSSILIGFTIINIMPFWGSSIYWKHLVTPHF